MFYGLEWFTSMYFYFDGRVFTFRSQKGVWVIMGLLRETRVGNVLAGWNHLSVVGPVNIKMLRVRVFNCRLVSGAMIILWGGVLVCWGTIAMSSKVQLSKHWGEVLPQYETDEHRLLSEMFCAAVPCAEKLRLVNSGLEATMYATRIARAITGRRIIIKFEGHFHGLNDSLTWNVDSSPRSGKVLAGGELERLSGTVGIPDEFGSLTVAVSWNDLEALENAFEKHKDNVAGVILEPVALNIGCIKPDESFLQNLRALSSHHGALLIFDEVLTGFRANIGGAQKILVSFLT